MAEGIGEQEMGRACSQSQSLLGSTVFEITGPFLP